MSEDRYVVVLRFPPFTHPDRLLVAEPPTTAERVLTMAREIADQQAREYGRTVTIYDGILVERLTYSSEVKVTCHAHEGAIRPGPGHTLEDE